MPRTRLPWIVQLIFVLLCFLIVSLSAHSITALFSCQQQCSFSRFFHRWLLILANQCQFNFIKFRICVDSSALSLLHERQYVSKGSRLSCLHVTLRWDDITSVHAFVTFDTASLNGSCVCVCPSFLLSLGWCTRRRSGRKSGMNC